MTTTAHPSNPSLHLLQTLSLVHKDWEKALKQNKTRWGGGKEKYEQLWNVQPQINYI